MMRTGRPFRWVEAAKSRHAIPERIEAKPGQEMTAICGACVVIADRDRSGGFPYPECADCDRVWRDVEGIPQRVSRDG